MTQRFELVLHMMKLIQHPAPAGVVLRSALAALLLATALPALAQFEVEPESAMQESASRDLIAHEMLTALVTAFHMLTGAAAQVHHIAQNNQPPQAPSQLGVEQVRVDPANAAPPNALKSLDSLEAQRQAREAGDHRSAAASWGSEKWGGGFARSGGGMESGMGERERGFEGGGRSWGGGGFGGGRMGRR